VDRELCARPVEETDGATVVRGADGGVASGCRVLAGDEREGADGSPDDAHWVGLVDHVVEG
jgi:hypothetical protein